MANKLPENSGEVEVPQKEIEMASVANRVGELHEDVMADITNKAEDGMALHVDLTKSAAALEAAHESGEVAPEQDGEKSAEESGEKSGEPSEKESKSKEGSTSEEAGEENSGLINKAIAMLATAAGTFSGWFNKLNASAKGFLNSAYAGIRQALGLSVEDDKETAPDAKDSKNVVKKYEGEVLDKDAKYFTIPAGTVHRFTSPFGERIRPYDNPNKDIMQDHLANDIGVPEGTPIVAPPGGGKVTILESLVSKVSGHITKWRTEDGSVCEIHHLQRAGYPPGTVINPGEIIGYSGSSGTASTGPHMHFMLKKEGGKWIDPRPYLGEKLSGIAPQSGAEEARV